MTLYRGWAGWGDKSPRVRSKGFEKNVRAMSRRPFKCDGCEDCFALPDPPQNSTSCPKCRRMGSLHRRRIFPSLMDWLDPMVPIEWLEEFLTIVHETPNLDWLLLTKRPELWKERIYKADQSKFRHYLPGEKVPQHIVNWYDGIAPHNVWVGVTVEDQKRADERIPELLKIPAKVHWLSVEPLLERLDLGLDADEEYVCSECRSKTIPTEIPTDDGLILKCSECGAEAPQEFYTTRPAIDWVVVGGESGGKRRDCGPEAIVDIADQCQTAGVPVWVKQDCSYSPGQQGRILNAIWALKQLP